MKRTSSILWILFLLAALFLGPAVILRHPAEALSLRDEVAQEELLDAVAPLKTP
ncbi:MAG: hypothetical protein HYZ75_18050 [Elusimicrobia bacterium]|nr:hypothetical protein [Elusimicrobiota bacterium]